MRRRLDLVSRVPLETEAMRINTLLFLLSIFNFTQQVVNLVLALIVNVLEVYIGRGILLFEPLRSNLVDSLLTRRCRLQVAVVIA